MNQFDRNRLVFRPLAERINRVIFSDGHSHEPSDAALERTAGIARSIRRARENGAARMMVFGAHTIKNLMGPYIAELLKDGWISHLATNGAGVIHDWELSYSGKTSEHVKESVSTGSFGMWEETGRLINLSINIGGFRGWGYGESVGHLVADDGLVFPSMDQIQEARNGANLDRAGAAADLLGAMQSLGINPGRMEVRHSNPDLGLQRAALAAGIPFTAHPMIGHDIIYLHPACSGSAIGRTADRDFLRFVHSVGNLQGGVYLSVGSAVMSPMVFEKSLSMARNIAIPEGDRIDDFDIYACDLAEIQWDWSNDGEPPPDDPAYYVRFSKSFSRMGARYHYLNFDASELFPALATLLLES